MAGKRVDRVARVVAVGGLDPGGGAGITADVSHLRALAAVAGAVATCVVPQDMRRIREVRPLEPELVGSQLRAAIDVVRPQVIKVSLLPDPGVAETVAATARGWKRRPGRSVVYDPVMHASVGGRLSAEPGEWLRSVLSVSDAVTPNASEALALASAIGGKASKHDVRAQARTILSAMPHDRPVAVAVKSATPGTDMVFERGRIADGSLDAIILRGPDVRVRLHGTGCAHASALAAFLARGTGFAKAAAMAKWYVESLLADQDNRAVDAGADLGLLLAIPDWSWEQELHEAVAAGTAALESTLDHVTLPEVGTNIAYALPLATDLGEVAALDSRIVRRGETVRSQGMPSPWVDSHMARMALAASNFDPSVRSCCNLRYSPRLVAAARRAGLRVVELDRTLEGEGETMKWLVERAAGRAGRLPDAVFDRGAPGKEAMVRFLGRDPPAVVRNVIASVKRMYRKGGRTRSRRRNR